jgi:putative PIN family toxin of toxin-antitoxin system
VRVVLDTNIVVSACWKSDGLEAQLVDLAIARKITACVSAEILAEYRDVLSRPKLSGISGRAVELLAALERAAVVVETTAQVRASIDEDDNRFLECAEAAGADFLITGNLRHYPANWARTRITNARAFVSLQYKE